MKLQDLTWGKEIGNRYSFGNNTDCHIRTENTEKFVIITSEDLFNEYLNEYGDLEINFEDHDLWDGVKVITFPELEERNKRLEEVMKSIMLNNV